ncbi:MAG: fructosamine kinase family protein [Myxococcales bacterium]|nr:MAG: fructosamine kinase family protein [Myxococcales bacterium]
MISKQLQSSLASALGSPIKKSSPLGGGDIGDSFRAELDDGRCVFIKTARHAAYDLFEKEAEGLAWLDEAKAIRIPKVLTASKASASTPGFIALEFIEQGPSSRDHDEKLGHGLAKLHTYKTEHYGFTSSNYIGSLDQSNAKHLLWIDFYREERLMPMIKLAQEKNLMPASVQSKLDEVLGALDALCGPERGPARLHGDLWSGNAISDEKGDPVLIDPAVYGGHPEIDLAMMKLFGGFSSRCMDAYQEINPLDPGYEERVPLYQLYPLLVHVNLFGSAYLSSVERSCDELL